MIITITGRYRGAETTVRAKKVGAELVISERQYREAERRCCYAGTDYGVIEQPEGYGPFVPTRSGYSARQLYTSPPGKPDVQRVW